MPVHGHAVPPSFPYKLGYRMKDFIKVSYKMSGANRSDLGVIGAVVIKFSCNGYSTKQLCYL